MTWLLPILRVFLSGLNRSFTSAPSRVSKFQLYSDDEYRLLRQNMFERFATSTAVPTEASIVPVSRPRPPEGKCKELLFLLSNIVEYQT